MVEVTDINVLRSHITDGRLKTVYEDAYHGAVSDSESCEILLKAFADQDGDEIYCDAVYHIVNDLGLYDTTQFVKHLTSATQPPS